MWPFTKRVGPLVIVAGAGTISYHVWNTRKKLNGFVGHHALRVEKKTPEYIYVDALPPMEDADMPVPNAWRRMWRPVQYAEAWRLLHLAQTGSKTEREFAIHALSKLHYLQDGDCIQLAQSCDARTAVGLARWPATDLRLFKTPPKLAPLKIKNLSDELKELLQALPQEDVLPCIKLFANSALPKLSEPQELYEGKEPEFDEDGSLKQPPHTSKQLKINERTLVSLCLQALLSHSAFSTHCLNVVSTGGLETMMRVFNEYSDDIEIIGLLSQVIANICVCQEYIEEIYSSGWISVLAQLVRSPHIQLSVPAANALYNLDLEAGPSQFVGGIFLLHPMYREKEYAKVDVVFVHGLLGSVWYTWRQRDDDKPARTNGKRKRVNVAHDGSEDEIAKADASVLSRIWRVYEFLRPFGREEQSTEAEMARVELEEKGEAPENVSSDAVLEDQKNRSVFRLVKKGVKKLFSKDDADDSDVHVGRGSGTISSGSEDDPSEEMSTFGGFLDDEPVGSQNRPNQPSLMILGKLGVLKQCEDENERTECWPRDWLPSSCSGIRVIGVNYDTAMTTWRRTLLERSEELLQKLRKAGVGTRPVVFVTHSMGGLLVKEMLVQAWESGQEDLQQLCKNTRSIFFLSTPHRGSHLAALNPTTQMFLLPSVEVTELRQNCPQLLELHDKFLKFVDTFPLSVVSFAETVPTRVSSVGLRLMFVSVDSSDPGVGEFYELPLDHMNVCKPASKQSFIYQKVVDAINRVAQSIK